MLRMWQGFQSMLQMWQGIQSDPSSNDSDEFESARSNLTSPEIQSDESESEDISIGRLFQERNDSEEIQQRREKEGEERQKYLEIYLPLYEASIICDWKAAKAILDKNQDMNLLRQSITENNDIALHIAASVKGPKKKVEEFVRNLVERMTPEDLEIVNNNHSTALYIAVTAGNIESVEIMMEKNPILDMIPGGGGDMMPLYRAVLYGYKDVAEYLYKRSKDLVDDDVWTVERRISLLEKCVESDMFDIALKIVKSYRWLGRRSSNLLILLAQKPEAFHEKKYSNTEYIRGAIKSGKHSYLGINISFNSCRALFRLFCTTK